MDWDRILSEVPEKNAFYIKQIGQERLDWLNSLPLEDELEGGYAINTGSVGNNLGVPRAHALLLEGDPGIGSIRITILSVPYDNRMAAEIADSYPELPKKEAYQNEVMKGVYSR